MSILKTCSNSVVHSFICRYNWNKPAVVCY